MSHAPKFILALLVILSSARCAAAQAPPDREKDRLNGTVRSVRVEYAHLFERDGRQIEGRRIPQTETTYDLEGRMIGRLHLNLDGSVESKTGYTYDGGGRLVEMISYDPDGTASFRWAYAYDDAGRKAEESVYNREGLISTTQRYTYSADGSLLLRSVYAYNAKGQIASRVDYKADGSVEGRYVYKYHPSGGLKRIAEDKRVYFYCRTFHVEEQLTPVEYDSYGNWTKSIGAETVTYRTITYH